MFFFVLGQLIGTARGMAELLLFHFFKTFLRVSTTLIFFTLFSGGGRGGAHISLKVLVSCEQLIL